MQTFARRRLGLTVVAGIAFAATVAAAPAGAAPITGFAAESAA